MSETVVISFVKIVWGFMRLTVSCFIDSFFFRCSPFLFLPFIPQTFLTSLEVSREVIS